MKEDQAPVVDETAPVSKYSEDELVAIFDDIVFQGEYSEKIVKNKGRLTFTFRTRTSGEVADITTRTDRCDHKLAATLNQTWQLLNMAYALKDYNGYSLEGQDVDQRMKYIQGIPSPVLERLFMALNEFDEKVSEACRLGEENF